MSDKERQPSDGKRFRPVDITHHSYDDECKESCIHRMVLNITIDSPTTEGVHGGVTAAKMELYSGSVAALAFVVKLIQKATDILNARVMETKHVSDVDASFNEDVAGSDTTKRLPPFPFGPDAAPQF